jgi:hypothetical protein
VSYVEIEHTSKVRNREQVKRWKEPVCDKWLNNSGKSAEFNSHEQVVCN